MLHFDIFVPDSSFSNCGAPVDLYAWSQGVVTTAYPYGGSTGPYYWTPTGSNDPPNDDNNAYFTNRFGGTSSATAMVAGAAALVQSYTKSQFLYCGKIYIPILFSKKEV
jgi:hypothetical protein